MRVREKQLSGRFIQRAGVMLLSGALLAGSLCLTGCFGVNKPDPTKPETKEETTADTKTTKEAESDTKATKEAESDTKATKEAESDTEATKEPESDTKATEEAQTDPKNTEEETEEKSEPIPTETPTPTPAVHVHELQFHEGVVPTCQKAGHAEYYECTGCGKIYRDKECTQEAASVDALAIAAVDHDMKYEPFRYPNCEEGGCKGYYHCDMCGTWWADYGDGPGPVLEDHNEAFTEKYGHSLVRLEPEAATCEHAYIGTTCFRCSECGKFFLDSNGNTPAKESDVYENPSPHTLTHIPEEISDPEHHGTVEHWHCAFCNQNFLDAEGKTAVTDPDQLVLHYYYLQVVAGTVQEWCPVCGKPKPKTQE